MKKILVVYYSRTGMTKKLALSISDMLGADSEEIIDTKKRAWVVWYIMAGRDAALKRQTTIQTVTKNPSEYDMVCIGTPVWDFTMSAAIRTYLTMYEKQLPTSLIFFCTQASSWAETAIQEMASITGKKPSTTIVFSSKEISRDGYREELKKQLSQAWILRKEDNYI